MMENKFQIIWRIFDKNNIQYSTIEELKQSQDKVIIKIIKE